MRSQLWRGLGAAILAVVVGSTNAQLAGPLAGLDELLGKQKNLTTFRTYLKRYPQILSDVKAGDGITIFAPNDVAMAKIPSSILKQPFELNDTAAIVNALRYHVLKGSHPISSFKEGLLENWETISTDSKYTAVRGGQRVTTYKSYDDVVTVITGLGTRSTLLTPDLTFPGGLVHTIDSPLIPPQDIKSTTTQYNLTGFQGSLYASNKLDSLSKAQGITIFAPKNDAFQAIGSALSTLRVEDLSDILDYHVISNQTLYSPSLTNGTTLVTSSGQTLNLLIFGNKLFVNTAQVTEKDILLANGVIHTIDVVLNPDNKGKVPDPEKDTQPLPFSGATSATIVPFTTAIPCTTACSTSGAAGAGATGAGGSGVRTTSSRAIAAAIARETGFSGAMKVAAAVVGGAVMMI